MSSLTWRLGGNGHEPDDLPACTLCRRRKLRCSRDVPACNNCTRTGSNCTYDAKSKPGLKTGAVEALSRRLAVLEKLLLDEQGTPFVTFEQSSRSGGRYPYQSQSTAASDDGALDGGTRDSSRESLNGPLRYSPLFNTKDAPTLLQALPSRQILIRVVNYFCTSFHHWIPYLHKAKCQNEAQKIQVDPDLAPVLHAMVAVVLPRLRADDLDVALDQTEMHRQTTLSASLALQYSVTNATLQSLQTLLILVFEKIMDGEILQTSPLIASLVRTVDFLQLTTEPGMLRSQALMRPLETLEPTSDWTELEARRRLFWCIFALDRYTSAHTGWNTSLTAEDVYRRLPADGGYFTRETPVNCPFFGIWNKAYANLGSPLSAHVPTQYQEIPQPGGPADVDSTTPGSQASVDSSKMGAFAYSIEAIESLHQVTTFFLQQRIDWQNRQHVLDWLTRFKELDLRLIHWKMFLPPRWKDSDISVDTTRIDMDPNLTLAHLTHNTSMILLHYAVAFPPTEWAAVIQLPSSCSRETCQMAAVEISRITDKFLCHTSIPFVSPQFSFCVFVAAKLLLASCHSSKQPILAEFNHLLKSLWHISNSWVRRVSSDRLAELANASDTATDLAASYAMQLEKLHSQCQKSVDFEFDFFDHSGRSKKRQPFTAAAAPAAIISQSPHTIAFPNSSTRSQQAAHARRQQRNSQKRTSRLRAATTTTGRQHDHQQQQPNPGQSIISPSTGAAYMATPSGDDSYPTRTTSTYNLSPSLGSSQQQHPVQYDDIPQEQNGLETNSTSWPMFDFSDSLVDPQFLEQDRVITFEDTYFQTSNMDWS